MKKPRRSMITGIGKIVQSLFGLCNMFEKRHCTQRDSRVSVSRATRLVTGSNYAIWNSYSDPSESEDGGEGGGEAYQSSEKLRTRRRH